jgi:hypothetical protein
MVFSRIENGSLVFLLGGTKGLGSYLASIHFKPHLCRFFAAACDVALRLEIGRGRSSLLTFSAG